MTTAEQTVDEIERDAAETRAKLGERLDNLQDRLAPSKNVGRAIDYVKDNGGEVVDNLAGVVRNNPVPVLMIGAGLAWLMLSKNGKDEQEAATTNVADGAQAAPGIADESSTESQGRVKQADTKIKSQLASAREGAAGTVERIGAGASRAKESSARFIDRHPLAVGAAGLAVGALLAAALPTTRREDQLVGEKSDAVKQAARQVVSEKSEELRSAASAVVQSAKAEAEKQGLKPAGSQARADKGPSGKGGNPTPASTKSKDQQSGSDKKSA